MRLLAVICALLLMPLPKGVRAMSASSALSNTGRVILSENIQTIGGVKKNVLTQAMLSQPNTVYIIQHDYTLSTSITIPANSSLNFEGGSVNGNNTYKLNLNSCYIDGDAKFRDVVFDGTIKNGEFNVLWIDKGDIGERFNKANCNFLYLYLPAGEYVFTTPIKINVEGLRCEGNLKYNGVYTNNQGVFTITCWAAKVHVHGLEPYDRSKISYLDTRKTNAVGLEIRSCNNSEFHVDKIQYFNENIRISDLDGKGCSYNKFFLGVIASGNFNIRLYQQDNDQRKISWTNENHFFGGRLTHWTDNAKWGEYYNIGVGGPAIDKPSYKNKNAKDHEDTCNGLSFIGTSIETNRISLLLRNVTDSQFIGMRQESNPGFAKVIGSFERIYYVPKFADISNILNSDFSEATSISFVNYNDIYNIKKSIDIDRCITADNKVVPYSGFVCDKNSLRDISVGNSTQVGSLINIGKRDICAGIFISKPARVYIRFLDSNNNNITENYKSLIIGYQLAYYPNHKAFVSAADVTGHQIHLPCNDGKIAKVFIGCEAGNGAIISLYTNEAIGTPSVQTRGSSAKRPAGLPSNVHYYDTDLKRNLLWDGVHWVDENGKQVN